MAEDCEFKDRVRQCPQCFDCVTVSEHLKHVKELTCIRYDPAVLRCPLCAAAMPRQEQIWRDHLCLPPFCPENPRTQQRSRNNREGGDESQTATPPVDATAAAEDIHAPAVIVEAPHTSSQAQPEAHLVDDDRLSVATIELNPVEPSRGERSELTNVASSAARRLFDVD
jgi:hypothetical protein